MVESVEPMGDQRSLVLYADLLQLSKHLRIEPLVVVIVPIQPRDIRKAALPPFLNFLLEVFDGLSLVLLQLYFFRERALRFVASRLEMGNGNSH